LVGIIDLRERCDIDEPILRAMNDSQIHRGPDDGGYHLEPGVGLGHRRLSIIDLSAGKQPLYNEDESVVVVYNGEIYNFQALRIELEAAGHRFRTRTDTEVIVHAWEEWGRHCVERFRGMFAFALWDRNSQSLLLARDRLGIKPLYYSVLSSGQLLVASELKALLAHPGVERTIDPLAVEDYFAYGYVPEPRSILSTVRKMPPGHILLAVRGRPVPEPDRYWQVNFAAAASMQEGEAIDALREKMQEAVRIRMIADVPVGAFLSGGVDSSGVVTMMARASDSPINTCSISFGDPAFNESTYAQQMADRLATNHFVSQVDPDDFSLIDQLAGIYDEPFADSSALPTYRVCELARRHVKVALSGDGGDEVFAGYSRYRWHASEERFRRLLPDGFRRSVFAALARMYPRADWAPRILRAKATLEAVARDSLDAYFDSVSLAPADTRRRLFSPQFNSRLQGYDAREVLRGYSEDVRDADPVTTVQYLDMKTYMVGDILTKVDRASMANSLEVRVPLLDHELVEWAATLPANLKLRQRDGKYVLKKALSPDVPDDILYRPKMGFAVPMGKWFRSSLREDLRRRLLHGTLGDTGMFDMTVIRDLVDQHQAGDRDNSAMLWSLMIYESFNRQVQG